MTQKGEKYPLVILALRFMRYHKRQPPGADQGIFVRGGPTFRKILTSKKKKERGREGGGFSIYSASVWLNLFLPWKQLFFYKYDIPRCFLWAKRIRDDCFSFVKCVSDVTVGGGLGVLPQIFFGFNAVKLCNFRQNKHGNGTFMKARDSMYEGRGANPLNLKVIRIFEIFTSNI